MFWKLAVGTSPVKLRLQSTPLMTRPEEWRMPHECDRSGSDQVVTSGTTSCMPPEQVISDPDACCPDFEPQ